MFLARLIASSVAQNDQWYKWVDFDIDEGMFLPGIVFADDECGTVDAFSRE